MKKFRNFTLLVNSRYGITTKVKARTKKEAIRKYVQAVNRKIHAL